MDRYISSTAAMNSVCRSVFCFKSVVVSVAILGVPALLHARLSAALGAVGLGANP